MHKRYIKKAAAIYAAACVRSAMECGAYSDLLTDAENAIFQDAVNEIAERLANKTVIGAKALHIGSIDDCVEIIGDMFYE